MPNVDKINSKLTDELAVLRQRIAELEQSEVFYQQRQAALEEQLTKTKTKLAIATQNPQNQVADDDIESHLEQEKPTGLNMPENLVGTLQQLQQEIAERQQLEIIFKESEERLRLALDVSQMGLWDWNIITNQVTWSENYEMLFGLTPSSFDGPYETFQKCVYPEDKQSVMQGIGPGLFHSKSVQYMVR
ncbi:MAG: PAS domain-containing protein [Nostoc sp.]|uniref:PAS domain-containing protein n=1 Tax=Nostoc sp. TaxID=1180 RepID=UPI002FF5B827